MPRFRQWQKAYGRLADFDFAALPPKLSSIRLGRLLHCKQACTY